MFIRMVVDKLKCATNNSDSKENYEYRLRLRNHIHMMSRVMNSSFKFIQNKHVHLLFSFSIGKVWKNYSFSLFTYLYFLFQADTGAPVLVNDQIVGIVIDPVQRTFENLHSSFINSLYSLRNLVSNEGK